MVDYSYHVMHTVCTIAHVGGYVQRLEPDQTITCMIYAAAFVAEITTWKSLSDPILT